MGSKRALNYDLLYRNVNSRSHCHWKSAALEYHFHAIDANVFGNFVCIKSELNSKPNALCAKNNNKETSFDKISHEIILSPITHCHLCILHWLRVECSFHEVRTGQALTLEPGPWEPKCKNLQNTQKKCKIHTHARTHKDRSIS